MLLYWPLTAFLFTGYRRRFHAALIVLLGDQTFEKLSPDDRLRVDKDVDENWRSTDTPPVAYRAGVPPDVLAAERAGAMDRLGIPPCVPGVTWAELFHPWRRWRNVPQPSGGALDERAAWALANYRIFETATEDAKKFLQERGLAVDDVPAPYLKKDRKA